MKNKNSFLYILLLYVRSHKGVTGDQIMQHFYPDHPKNTISNTLGRLRRMRLIENRGKGGRWSEWFPVEFETVDPTFMEIGQQLISEMRNLPKSERAAFLARYLQNKSQKKHSV